MQTFSNMQRNSTLKKTLNTFFWVGVYLIYSSLSTIYLFLPPLIAFLFIIFIKALQQDDTINLLGVIISSLIIEAQNGFLAFSLLIFFLISYKFIVPKIKQNINSQNVRIFLYIVYVYIGYTIFSFLIAQMFLLPTFGLNFYIVIYIMIEYILARIIL